MGLGDLNAAARMAEIVDGVVRNVVGQIFPRDRYGTIVSVDTAGNKAMVKYPDEVLPIAVSYETHVPVGIGAVVRVTGMSGARYIAGVVGGQSVPIGARNRLMNGGILVNQRRPSMGPGAESLITFNNTLGYITDRWLLATYSNASVYTGIDDQGLHMGDLSRKLVIESTGTASPTAGQYSYLRQIIEANNLRDWRWGTVAAKPVTFSFLAWNTYGNQTVILEFEYYGSSQSISRAITVTNVPTIYTVTIPGNTSGTMPTAAGAAGLGVNVWLASGSTYAGGAQLKTNWGAFSNQNERAFGVTNHFSATARQFHISGLQVEAGSIATPFEHVPIHEELARCQRYAFYPNSQGQASNAITAGTIAEGHTYGQSSWVGGISFPVTMRVNPALDLNGAVATDFMLGNGLVAYQVTSLSLDGNRTTPNHAALLAAIGTASMTNGVPYNLLKFNNAVNPGFSAEF